MPPQAPLPTLILGTVQLGMPYGIANTTGQPDYATARAIVQTALDNDITYFDTAQAYGDSERILGEILEELGAHSTARIASKLASTLDPSDGTGIARAIEASLTRLRTNQLWCMLLHQPAWLASWENGVGETLRRYREQGRIAHLGVSLNTPNDAPPVLAHPEITVMQAPCNAWDRRMRERGYLETARNRGQWCYIRSIYLQGLLTMPPEDVAARLPIALSAATHWWELARELRMSPKELAMRYALTLGVPLVVGAESPAQVAETARLATLPPLTPQEVDILVQTMTPWLTEAMVEPWQWKTP